VMCGSVRYHDADITVPATYHIPSSKLHSATSAKLAHRNDVKECNEHHFFLGSDEVWFLWSGDNTVCHSDDCIFISRS
jgi:hypothetical protein